VSGVGGCKLDTRRLNGAEKPRLQAHF